MLTITRKHKCKVHNANSISCSLSPEDGSEVCKMIMRLEVPLGIKDLESLPISAEAIEILAKESEGIKKGKNTTDLKVKRDYALGTYALQMGDELISFSGEVKNTPTVGIVMGKIVASWTVEAQVNPDIAAQLVRLPTREGITIKCSQPLRQAELPLEDEATG